MRCLRWVVGLSLGLTQASAFAAISEDVSVPMVKKGCEEDVSVNLGMHKDLEALATLAVNGDQNTTTFKNIRQSYQRGLGYSDEAFESLLQAAIHAHRNAKAPRTSEPPTKLLAELVEFAKSGTTTDAARAKLQEYMDVTGRSEAQASEDVSMAVLMAASETTSPPFDEKNVVAALNWAREKRLSFPAALMSAIEQDYYDLVQGFLAMHQHGNDICQTTPGYRRFCKTFDLTQGWLGRDFLIEAAKVSDHLAGLLIKHGLRVPLARLASLKHANSISITIRELVRAGAPVDAQDLRQLIQNHHTTAALEVLGHYPQLAEEDAGHNEFPLITATRANDVDVVEFLLNTLRTGVDQKADDMPSAIFIAVALKHSTILEKLIDAGADVNQRFNGVTPLIQAILSFGQDSADRPVTELLLAGADVNAPLQRDILVETPDLQFKTNLLFGASPKEISELLYRNARVGLAQTELGRINSILATNGGK